MSSTAKNLEAIDKAMNQHDERCTFPLVALYMNPYEVERLGWDRYRGVPIREDEKMGTGRFRLECARPDGEPEPITTEAVSRNAPVGA